MRPTGDGGRNVRSPDQRIRPSSASAARNERNANNPKLASAHEPIDMGDQYLNIGR